MDMDVLAPILEVRARCVEEGKTLPVLDKMVASLKNNGPMVTGANAKRGEWCQDLDIKDYTRSKVKVIFHAGCLTAYRREMWKPAQAAISILKKSRHRCRNRPG